MNKIIEVPIKDFEDHLQLDYNTRIFFSGIFGIGKTWFLNRFFKDHVKYTSVHLYPVNYSVSSNEDIFELIKTDILFQLLNFESIQFEKIKLPKLLKLQSYLQIRAHQLLPDFLKNLDKVGDDLELTGDDKLVSKGLIALSKIAASHQIELKKFEEKSESSVDLQLIKAYFDKSTDNEGGIYENNAITELINSILIEYKNNTEKEVVLIIDDIDRLDPHDIFRILNIFSAHFDSYTSENKFGFDKTIIVADHANLRSIYKHRYGAETDFVGYLNKFYSKSIYHYDNSNNIKSIIGNIISSPNLSEAHYFQNVAHELIRLGVNFKYLSLRSLLDIDWDLLTKKYPNKIKVGSREVSPGYLPFISFHCIMAFCYEGEANYLKAMQKLKDVNDTILADTESHHLKFLLPILDFDQLKQLDAFNSNPTTLIYSNKELGITINYELDTHFPAGANNIEVRNINASEIDNKLEKVNLLHLIEIASRKLIQYKIINY